MLQVQQTLIDEITSQLSSNPPFPEQLKTWAEHPVTIHFLNELRLAALDRDTFSYVHLEGVKLERQICLDVGYSTCVNDVETKVEEYRKGAGEDE